MVYIYIYIYIGTITVIVAIKPYLLPALRENDSTGSDLVKNVAYYIQLPALSWSAYMMLHRSSGASVNFSKSIVRITSC